MDTGEHILNQFKRYKDRFIFLTRYPLNNSNFTERLYFSNEKFCINKVYSFDLFIGYSFDFFGKDVTFASNFLNYIENNSQTSNEPCSILLKTDNFLVLAKTSYNNILIVGNTEYDTDFFFF